MGQMSGVRMRWIFFGGGFVGIGYHDKVVEGHYQKLLSRKTGKCELRC